MIVLAEELRIVLNRYKGTISRQNNYWLITIEGFAIEEDSKKLQELGYTLIQYPYSQLWYKKEQ